MKKLLLGALFLVGYTSASAQGLEIQIDGTGADVSGTTVVENVTAATSFPLEVHFVVTNNTGTDGLYYITRVIQSGGVNWSDNVCWPPQCYLTGGAQLFSTPNTQGNPAPTLVNGSDTTTTGLLSELKPQIFPDETVTGSATYMYYLTNSLGTFVDSVALEVNFSLGLEETAPSLNVNVAPNPASDFINISANGTSDATVRIVDVLGNVVLRETAVGAGKNVDVSKFRNGIYFVMVEAEGVKPVTRKVIVRH